MEKARQKPKRLGMEIYLPKLPCGKDQTENFRHTLLGLEISLQKSPDSAKIAYFIFALKGKFRDPVVISLYFE